MAELAWKFNIKGYDSAALMLSILKKLDTVLDKLAQKEQQTAQASTQLDKAFQSVDSGLQDVVKKLDAFQTAATKASGTTQNFTKKFDQSTRTHNTFKNTLDQSSHTVNKYSSSVDKSTRNQQKYDQRVDNSTHVQQKFDQRVDNSVRNQQRYSQKIDASTRNQQKYDQRIDASIRNHQKYDNRVDNSVTVINRYSAATQKTSGRISGLGRTLTHIAGVWNTWNKAVDFAAKRFRQFTAFMTGWEGKLRTVGGAFERNEATLRVLADSAGSSQDEINSLVTTVKTLGRETEFTAKQAADGAITLLKGGNDASQTAVKLQGALDAATATGLSFSKAAKVGNYAWNIFGKNLGKTGNETKNYTTALKVMVASANSADVEVLDLAKSLTNGGNILADMGVSLTRTTTALGLLANNGITGQKAMRLLAISLKRMVDGTATSTKALRTLGVTATDETGNLKDLGVLMEEIGNRLDLRKPSEQVKLMKDLFGAGDKVMRALLDAGVSGFDELENSIEGALGTMEELREAKVDTIVGAWKQFQSAVEGVWVELVEILRVPVIEYWTSLSEILRAVGQRIADVGLRFKENGKTLQDWLALIKREGITGLFQGLPEELRPQIEKLKTLWFAFLESSKAIFAELWATFLDSGVQEKAKTFAESLGKALLSGMKKGMGEKAFDKLLGAANVVSTVVESTGKVVGAAKQQYEQRGGGRVVTAVADVVVSRNEKRERDTLETYYQSLQQKKNTLIMKPADQMTTTDNLRLNKINKEMEKTQSELSKLPTRGQNASSTPSPETPSTPSPEPPSSPSWQSDVDRWEKNQTDVIVEGIQVDIENAAKAKAERQSKIDSQQGLRDEWQRKREQAEAYQLNKYKTPKVRMTTASPGQSGDFDLVSDEEIKAQQQVISAQQQLNDETKKVKETLAQSKTVLNDMNVEVNNIGASFQQWLLAPVNVFRQQLLQAKDTFGGMIDSLREKKINLAETFGLTSPKDAAVQRKTLTEDALKRDKKLLDMAQTPEERAKIQERMAGRAASLAESATGQDRKTYAIRAQGYYTQSQESIEEAQHIKEQQVQIQQEAARKNITQYEAMVQHAGTATQKASALEGLQQAYQAFGSDYAVKAQKVTEELKVAKTEAATEEAERLKQMAENSTLQVELLTRLVETSTDQLNTFRRQSSMPPNEDYSLDAI